MPELESISISNFRTIGDTVTIPLDAPVVLIHGPNGAGKTSVLSALELALTGSVESMRRTEPEYLSHLVHRGAESSDISLKARGVDGRSTTEWMFGVRPGEVIGQPVLDIESARFFGERCYLAQSVLGRLLEIYEHSDSHQDSPLTRFVNDLLGLDILDVLIDGLRGATDARNTRNLVPAYASAIRMRDECETEDRQIQTALESLNAQATAARSAIFAEVQQISPSQPAVPALDPLDDLSIAADATADETQSVALTNWRREVVGLLQRAQSLGGSLELADIAALERAAGAARTISEEWGSTTGNLLEQLINELRGEFPDLPSSATTDPTVAFDTALARTRAELTRCNELIMTDDAATSTFSLLSQSVEQARSRIALLNEQLATETTDAAGLAGILSALLPHIHDDDCPVCGRNYSEISTEPLSSRIAVEISRFSERADRMTQLSSARLEAESDLSNSEQQLALAASRRLAQDNRISMQARASTLAEWSERFARIEAGVSTGAGAIRADAEASRDLAAARNRAQLSVDLRAAVTELCKSMSVPKPDDLEPVDDTLQRLEGQVRVNMAATEARIQARRRIVDQQRDLVRIQVEIERREVERTALAARRLELDNALRLAEQRRYEMRVISRATSETRATIVRQVFNQSLNEIWRDLFVRLAPGEPYVPAFRVPEAGRRLTAQLITTHRSGGQGGSPGAMLSAGNLNTAALTLFLGLHLTAGERLPWLVLDDPVQSMDEIHISQFAALLRTLSKEHGRRIVVAVHERPLFEYLALELSPAYEGDRLITVELKKTGDDQCIAESSFHHWQPDPVAEVA